MPDLRTSRPFASYDNVSDDPRLAPIVADVRRRLARACAHFPVESFERLVDRIARTKLRWKLAEAASRGRYARRLQEPPDSR